MVPVTGTNRSTEDYLKAIYQLESRGERASTSAVAGQLRVADASITGMLKKLSRRGLVRYRPYRGAELTDRGKAAALKIVRRHRLWEMFLVRFLGCSWDEIHAEAERLEHATSEFLEEKLDHALGSPSLDPHGDPIPSVDGTIGASAQSTLASAGNGAVVVVARVAGSDPEMLKYASSLGIRLRSRLRVTDTVRFDGSLRVQVGGDERFISAKLAQNIFVEPAERARRRRN